MKTRKQFIKTFPARAVALALGLFVALAALPLHAQYFYQDVYELNCSVGGCLPYDFGQLIQWTDGNLYGTATSGGQYYDGTIFDVSPSATENDVWQFNGTLAGSYPGAALTLRPDNQFFGVTPQGGDNGYGGVFVFVPGSGMTAVHYFNGTDGQDTETPLVQARDGNFYGFTNSLTTYRVTYPGGVFQPLPGTVPASPSGPLVAGLDGYLYGTSSKGGTSNLGTIFRMTTAGVVEVIYSFTGGLDGAAPKGLLQASDGNFYGTTNSGGANGTGGVFQYKFTIAVKSGHVLNPLYSFTSVNPNSLQNADGANPLAGLVAASDGYLYGSTSDGGSNGCGTLFRISTGGAFTALDNFPNYWNCGKTNIGLNTGTPFSALVQHTNGCFYGTTYSGGTNLSNFNGGNVYSLCPNPTTTPNLTVVAGPIWVSPEAKVTIRGDNLDEIVNVTFAGVTAAFQPGSPTYLTATVPSEAVDGPIAVTVINSLGGEQTLQSQQSMHILPVITNLDPTSGPVGQEVGIVGGGFAGATKVTFGGVKCTSFTVATPSLIQAYVPAGAKTGKIVVTTPNGSATSKQKFTVN